MIAAYNDQAHGAGDHLNPAAFPLFLDTYMYLIDGRLDCQSPEPDLIFHTYFLQSLELTSRPTQLISSAITHKFTWPDFQLICLPNTDNSFAVSFHTHHLMKAWLTWYMLLSIPRDRLFLDIPS